MSFGEEIENEEGYKVFNDSVHGHIQMHPLCVKIIDTPEFQRLRNIKQLGATYFVYPGGSNNRFEHCLGVSYLAGEMIDALKRNQPSLKINEIDKLCVQIAGLCHDLGHGPYSHLWENFLVQKGIEWHHEDSSVAMFYHLLQSNELISEFEKYGLDKLKRKFITELILGEGKSCEVDKQFLFQIVCNKMNNIDVDKWDYLLRDGLHLNLKVSFDYKRLLNFCKVIEREENARKVKHICFKDKEAYNIYEMFLVRSSLHYRAYQHRVSLVIEQMIVDALLAADDYYSMKLDGNSEYKLSEAHENPIIWMKLTDNIFYDLLWSQSKELAPARKILSHIVKRKLYKFITSRNVVPTGSLRTKDPKWFTHLTNGIEKELNAKLNCNGCNCFTILTSSFCLASNGPDPFKNVYFYDKNNPLETYEKDWKDIPLFPVYKDSAHHLEIHLFCKNEDNVSVSIEEAKSVFEKLVNSFVNEKLQSDS